MTTYLMAPDRAAATGGVKVMYGIACALRQLGHEAVVWQSASQTSSEALCANSLRLEAGDRLWVVEVAPPETREELRGLPVVVLNQAHYYTIGIHADYPALDAPYPGWPDAAAVVATSESIRDYLAEIDVRLPVHHLRLYVDALFFQQAPPPSQRPRVLSFMPRRRETELKALVNAMRCDPVLRRWSFRPIDGLSWEGVADALRESAVFVHGAVQDGLGLPGLEAMAAGAYLAGFPGDGGREFMRPEFCTVLPDSDLTGSTRTLRDLLHRFDADPEAFDASAQLAREFAAENYGWDGFVGRVQAVQEALGDTARILRPVTIEHTTHLARRAQRLPLRKRLGMIRRAIRP